MEKLIISADDFDSDEKNRNRILELSKNKKIDRVGIIIGDHFSQAEIIELKSSQVKLDLHLTLSIEKNLHAPKTSCLKRVFVFLAAYLTGKISNAKIGRSWSEQIEKFKLIFGKNPDGLNSHQHVHFFPPYFKILLALAKKHSIPYVRFGRKGIVLRKNTVSLILFLLQKINRKFFAISNLASSENLESLDWTGKIKELPGLEVELVVHLKRDDEYEIIKNRHSRFSDLS